MSIAALWAFIAANKTQLLALWLVLEQFLAADKRIKANSTAQLLLGLIDALVKPKQN